VAAARRQRLLAERRSRDHITRNISATAAASRATVAARFAQVRRALSARGDVRCLRLLARWRPAALVPVATRR